MTDSEFKSEKRRVLKAYGRWRSATGMAAYRVHHEWHRDGTSGFDGRDRRCAALAQAHVAWEYFHVTFKWNLEQVASNTDDELDGIVRHEICHVLVAEMRMWGSPTQLEREVDEAMKHEERTVSALAFVLRWVRAAGEQDARKRVAKPRKTKRLARVSA